MLTLAALVAAGAGARAADAPRLPAPEVRTQGYRIVVEQLIQSQSVARDFAEPDHGALQGRQGVYVKIAVYPPKAEITANIQGLDPKILAFSEDNRPVQFSAYPADDANPTAGGAWRTLLMNQDVPLAVSRLNRLQGELVVYPKAHVVTLDFPITSKVPVTQSSDGFRATLKQLTVRKGTVSASIQSEWDPSLVVSRLDPEAPYGIVAITKAGSVIPPNGGGPGYGGRRLPANTASYAVSFTDLPEAPQKIRLQVMVRTGAPQHVAFTLPDLPLPDTLKLESTDTAAEPVEAELLLPSHPLYASAGGSLMLPVQRGTVGAPSVLLVGLSRKDGNDYGAWRWLEVPLPATRAARILHLKPGAYRLVRQWAAGGIMHGTKAVDVDIAARTEVSVPPLSLGGQP